MSEPDAKTGPDTLDLIRQNLTRLLRDNRVGTGPGLRTLTVSVTGERDRQELRLLHAALRSQGPAAKAVDWLLLGDGYNAAGEFKQADEVLIQAATTARADNDEARQAEALFKRFRTACELGRFEDALSAYGAAVALTPSVYELFNARRYEVVAILGVGGFGTVFQCRDLWAGKHVVAVKSLHDLDAVRDPGEVFMEARILKQLAHPNIIGIEHWDYADQAGQRRPYLVLDYFPGQSLENYLSQHGTLAMTDALILGRKVAEAMQAAHAKNVLYRDLKPGNILVRKVADGWDVRVVDFGLAVPLTQIRTSLAVPSGQRSLRDHAFVGTMKYASPEQRGERSEPVGPSSDIYSFGKTLIEMLLGTTQPVSRNWRNLPEEYRGPLQELLEDCIVEVPTERLANFEVLLARFTGLDQAKQRLHQDHERRLDENLQRWRETGQARQWVEARLGGWDHTAWTGLLAALRTGPFWPLREADIGQTLGQQRDEIRNERQRKEDETRQREEQETRHQAEANRQESVETRTPTPGQVRTFTIVPGVEINLAHIPPGSFLMGSPANEHHFSTFMEKQHRVTLTAGFWMGIYPVTQAQWRAVMGNNPSWFARQGARARYIEQLTDPEVALLPVECVSWDDAQEFCTKLSQLLGKRIALPTEAQWEYACRAGTTTPFHFGSVLKGDRANHDGNEPFGTTQKGSHLNRTSPVGSYPGNGWGLFDMHGNVREWCLDAYRIDYDSLPASDPICVQPAEKRVARGGDWADPGDACRAAQRMGWPPHIRHGRYGFRVCCLDG